jgi:hypothetical protein
MILVGAGATIDAVRKPVFLAVDERLAIRNGSLVHTFAACHPPKNAHVTLSANEVAPDWMSGV